MDGGCAWPNSSTACSSGTSPVRSSRTPSTRSSGTCVERCDRPAGPAGPSGPGRRRAHRGSPSPTAEHAGAGRGDAGRRPRCGPPGPGRSHRCRAALLRVQPDHDRHRLRTGRDHRVDALNRDVLDSVAAAPPARARAPRTRTAGMVVAIGFAVLGALFAILLWDRTPILAAAVVIACALLACLGPIWAGELASADDRLAVILDSDDELSERLSTFTPIWLHEAMEAEETRRNRS